MRYLFTFSLLLFSLIASAQLTFSASTSTSGNTSTVTVSVNNPTGSALNISSLTAVLYFDDDETSFSSANYSILNGLGWNTSGNTSESQSSSGLPNASVSITHNRRLEIQAFDGDGIGTSVGAGNSISLIQIVFDNSDGISPQGGGEAYLADAIEDGNGSSSGIQYFDNLFNGFDIQTSGNPILILPVDLLYFVANPQAASIKLSWSSISEINFEAYELQRSSSIDNLFSKIALIPGTGNIDQTQDYHFEDKEVQAGIDYYYRLKMIDWDKSFEYSPIETARISSSNRLAYTLFPNPGITEMLIKFESDVKNGNLSIFNSEGKLVHSATLEAGINTYTLNVSNWHTGLYFITIEANGENHSQKLIISN